MKKIYRILFKERFGGKKNLNIGKVKVVLSIFLYYDDFEVNNPLGSHWSYAPESRSIFFNSLHPTRVHSKTRKHILMSPLLFLRKRYVFKWKYFSYCSGWNKLFAEGSHYIWNDSKIYFALGLLFGNNLALNSALSYISSFRANCRFCKASRLELDCKI